MSDAADCYSTGVDIESPRTKTIIEQLSLRKMLLKIRELGLVKTTAILVLVSHESL